MGAASFGDVHVRNDLERGDHAFAGVRGHRADVLQDAIHPVADVILLLVWLEVNVGGPTLHGGDQHLLGGTNVVRTGAVTIAIERIGKCRTPVLLEEHERGGGGRCRLGAAHRLLNLVADRFESLGQREWLRCRGRGVAFRFRPQVAQPCHRVFQEVFRENPLRWRHSLVASSREEEQSGAESNDRYWDRDERPDLQTAHEEQSEARSDGQFPPLHAGDRQFLVLCPHPGTCSEPRGSGQPEAKQGEQPEVWNAGVRGICNRREDPRQRIQSRLATPSKDRADRSRHVIFRLSSRGSPRRFPLIEPMLRRR